MASIVGQIGCTDAGRWPVQREFNRRMKRRFQEPGIEIASAAQTIVMQVPVPTDIAADQMPRRAAGSSHRVNMRNIGWSIPFIQP